MSACSAFNGYNDRDKSGRAGPGAEQAVARRDLYSRCGRPKAKNTSSNPAEGAPASNPVPRELGLAPHHLINSNATVGAATLMTAHQLRGAQWQKGSPATQPSGARAKY
jgi:hypothetical protein